MSEQDKYDVLEKIGHGSFGIIRKVRRKTDGFIMCRKEISYLRMSQKEREQLHAEFQILSHLRHPNIVAYYHREHLKQSQDLHLYMEYCGNGDLGRVIKELVHKGVYAQENFVWSVLSQLVSALYRCHYGVDPPEVGSNVLGLFQREVAKGPQGNMTILHRDLKPENVFLGEDNSVKLGDFGLSKMIKSHDFASTYVGTPFYMSPEICAAEKYTLKSDIWSLGCIIYELCAREPPFNAKTHYQLVQKIKEGKVANLPDMYSPELNNVIKECLRVNPDTRPDTAHLVNLPIVRLMRKEKEVVDLNRLLRQREDALIRREKEATEKMSVLESDRALMRQEMDASVRREWEVKARLEIDRLVQVELETLKARFETEVQARVGREVAHQRTAIQLASRQSSQSSADFASSKSSSYHTSSSADDFPPANDATDMTEISVDSPGPQPPKATAAATANKRASTTLATRTPYTRAHTTIAANLGTPMDVEMASPSPVAIQNLSLSPRRTAATRAPGQPSGNLFATANAYREQQSEQRWEARDTASSADSDDEDMMSSPSLTRNLRSAKNPFTSKTRPILPSTRAAPMSRLKSAFSAAVSTKTAAAAAQAQANDAHESNGARSRNGSPDRKISKIPSIANLYSHSSSHSSSSETTPTPSITSSSSSLPRRGSVDMARKGANGSSCGGGGCPDSFVSSAPSLPRVGSATKTAQIRGRTLVELQQARAGGRPLSAVISAPPLSLAAATAFAENTSPKRAATGRGGGMGNDRRASSGPGVLDSGVAVWDPEKDEMPSPFLKRQIMRA